MQISIKTLLTIGLLTYSFSAFAQEGQENKSVDQGKSSMSQEMPGMMGMMDQMHGMMDKMQQMHGNMGDMMKNMSDPKMQEQLNDNQLKLVG